MIKLFEQYNDYIDIQTWMFKFGIERYTINDDSTIDVDQDVRLDGRGLTEIPIQFGKIIGYFDCSHNKLTTLKGSPYEVTEDFYCSYNKLTTLEYAPKLVGGMFTCEYNNLTSLKGCPEIINDELHCNHNKLTSLKYAPKELSDIFVSHSNLLPTEIEMLSDISKILKYQDEYGIWNSDGSFNKARFEIFKNEILK